MAERSDCDWLDAVRAELDRLGWSDYRLAVEIGAHRTVVSKWMRGVRRPSPRYRAAVASALGRPDLAVAVATAEGWR